MAHPKEEKSILPYSADAERAVLGTILLDDKVLAQIKDINPSDFFVPANQTLFHSILELHKRMVPVDLVTLGEELQRRGSMESIGGAGYLAGLTDDWPRVGNVQQYVDIVKKKSRQREKIRAAKTVMDAAESDPENLDQAIKAAKKARNGKEKNNGHINPEDADDWQEFWTEADGIHTRVYDKYGTPQNYRVCGPIEVGAITCDENNENWGRLLKWKDRDGREHSWAMPMQMMAGSGEECRKALLNGGLEIEPTKVAREKLLKFISDATTESRGISVTKVGWHNNVFVMPDCTIRPPDGKEGEKDEETYFYQPPQETSHNIRARGTAEEWKNYIGKFCAGNSRLVLAVSCAFAAPLVGMTDSESGGFHFYGDSSTGKSTSVIVAGSVWGGGAEKGYLETWRNTANGLEIFGEIHNDGLGCLDEIAEIDPRQLGEAVYMLANGQGKGRMTKSIGSRKRLTWRLLFLSSGELTLEDHLASAGRTVKTGMEVRLINITADAGARMGMFENIHGHEDAKKFSEYLTQTSFRCYGNPIREFIKYVAEHRVRVAGEIRKRADLFVRDHVAANAASEIRRACRRFGLACAAGELASEIGLTGWRLNEVSPMVNECLEAWLGSREPSESERGLRTIRQFIELHGSSRFQSATIDNTERIPNRAGFKKESDDGGIDFLFLPEVFRSEVCKGYDWQSVAKYLIEKGFMQPGKDTLSRTMHIPGLGTHRFFCVNSSIMR